MHWFDTCLTDRQVVTVQAQLIAHSMAEQGASDTHSDGDIPEANGNADASSSHSTEHPSSNHSIQPLAQPLSPDSADGNAHSQQNGAGQNAPATPEALHENNNGAAAVAEDTSAEGEDPAPAADEPWTKRLYFVRMPKPQEDNQYAVKVLQEEIDVYRGQVQLLNESMNVVKVSKFHKQ